MWDQMVMEAQRDLARCPVGAIHAQLRYSAREFARRSESWRVWHTMDVVEGRVSYQIVPNQNARIQDVHHIVLGEDHESGFEVPKSQYSVRLSQGNTFVVFRATLGSSRAAWLHLNISYVPGQGQEVDDNDWLSRWDDGIVSHCIYILARRSGRPWYSIELSERKYVAYLRQLNTAKRENLSLSTGASLNGGVNV